LRGCCPLKTTFQGQQTCPGLSKSYSNQDVNSFACTESFNECKKGGLFEDLNKDLGFKTNLLLSSIKILYILENRMRKSKISSKLFKTAELDVSRDV
jgi:hypothetical protein